MDRGLAVYSKLLRRYVRIGVAEQQQSLEKHKTRVPDSRRTTESGKKQLSDHRLHGKQQAGT
jgi:hypothetical protein